MRRRHPLPSLWLLTDERQGPALWTALTRLPRGSAVVVRHYGLSHAERRLFFDRVRRAGRGRLALFLAGDPRDARAWGANGVYTASHRAASGLLLARPVHNLREIRRAESAGADLLLLSPLFPTRSHPNGRTLGRVRFAQLARRTALPVIALGGVTRAHEPMLRSLGAYGRAGIDAFAEQRSAPAGKQHSDQKRNAVPI